MGIIDLLTPKQRLLLEIAKEKGSVTISDAILVYTSKDSSRDALRRLEALQFIEQDPEIFGKWKLGQNHDKM